MAEKSCAPGDVSMVFATVHEYETAKTMTLYEDEGEREEYHSQLLLIMRTMTCKMDELIAYLRDSHLGDPDDMVSIKVDNGSLPFLQWVSASVAPGGQDQK